MVGKYKSDNLNKKLIFNSFNNILPNVNSRQISSHTYQYALRSCHIHNLYRPKIKRKTKRKGACLAMVEWCL
jgi:hypothetical protein